MLVLWMFATGGSLEVKATEVIEGELTDNHPESGGGGTAYNANMEWPLFGITSRWVSLNYFSL